jgi:RND family efflux transporter MFP subunit
MKCRICFPFWSAFLLVVGIAGYFAIAQAPSGPAPVVASKVIQTRHAGIETFVGSLRPVRQSVIGSAVEGRVVSVAVEAGDPVSGPADTHADSAGNRPGDGQLLVQLLTATLDIEIGAANIQLQLAQQALQELETSIPKDLDLLAAKESEAKARLEYSKANSERLQRLASGAVSPLELELARSQYLADRQAALAATADLGRLDATREVRLLQSRSRIEAAEQELARLNDIKSKYSIRAPFHGYVTQKMTEVGAWVSAGDPLIEIVRLDPIEMIINVPQSHLIRMQNSLASKQVSQALMAQVEIDGIDEPFAGTVERIVPRADMRSRTYPVRILIDNKKMGDMHLLQPGMIGRAMLSIGQTQEMLMVKKDALVLNGDQRSVFKILPSESGETVIPVDVQTGVSTGDWIQISGDVQPNDSVVIIGNERLRPGQKVRVTETRQAELPDG